MKTTEWFILMNTFNSVGLNIIFKNTFIKKKQLYAYLAGQAERI